MSIETITTRTQARPTWQEIVAKYQHSEFRHSLWQVLNTFIPYFLLLYLMYRAMDYSYWITLALAVPAAGLLVRIFIIFHDCGHGSFFRSQKANNRLGVFSGILLCTPYYQWRHDHAIHHATSGDLDERGVGDVKTLTVKEYLALSQWGRFKYRVYRNPFILFGVGPLYLFLISQRFVSADSRKRERNSVYWTNAILLMLVVAMSLTIGLVPFLLIFLPIIVIATTAGVWLFYVQHQFEGTSWEHHETWDYATAALKGSSYYKLPKVLQWFTGNIGLHHVHHLNARIPNYKLQRCHDENPIFHEVTTITLKSSLKAISLKLWDEEQRKLISFRDLRHIQLGEQAAG